MKKAFWSATYDFWSLDHSPLCNFTKQFNTNRHPLHTLVFSKSSILFSTHTRQFLLTPRGCPSPACPLLDYTKEEEGWPRSQGQQAAVPRAVSFMSFDNSVSSCSHPFHLLMNVNYILAFNHRYHFIETWACASPRPRFSEHLFPRPPLEHECIHGSFPLLWATELHFLCTFKH